MTFSAEHYAEAQRLNDLPLVDCFDAGPLAAIITHRPGMFADSRVFVSREDFAAMAAATAAIERTVQLPGWQAAALSDAPAIARHPTATRAAFVGVDFHLTPSGPKLIEVNTNAGGGFINALLLRAQRGMADAPHNAAAVERQFVDMLIAEWRLERGTDAGMPQRIAVVDTAPETQYMVDDFFTCRNLLRAAGIDTVVCDPTALHLAAGRLQHDGQPVDLVYNRLTDFSFDEAPHAALREAWLSGAVVVTPNPRHHALYADKRNLIRLADGAWLESIGLGAADRAILAATVPAAERVRAENGEALWARRKSLFFKPVSGYGGKAVYRGMNVTKGVFADILAGDYVAQELAPASTRTIRVAGEDVALKCDLRCYAYAGQVQLIAARLWQGQTTNFRTPGGGFAPVLPLDEAS